MVTRNSGPVNPPSSLLVELPISIGPSMGPDPKHNVTCLEVVIFQPKVPAAGRRLPLDAMVTSQGGGFYTDIFFNAKCIDL